MSRRARVAQVAVLVVLAGVAAQMARRAVREVRTLRAVDAVCEAVAQRDFLGAVAASSDPRRFRAAAEAGSRGLLCRCTALAALGRESECRSEVANLLADPNWGDWNPDPELLAAGLDQLLAEERPREAWQALGRAREAAGEPALLADRELLARLRFEPEVALREFTERLQRGEITSPQVPVLMAARHLEDGQRDSALRLLGDLPPAGLPPGGERLWFATRSAAVAQQGDLAQLVEVLQAWRGRGLSEAEFLVRRALLASNLSLTSIEQQVGWLREAVAREDELDAPRLAIAARSRLVRMLATRGDFAEALALYDASVEKQGQLIGLDREELERLRIEHRPLTAPGARARVRFRGLEPGDRLVVSPEEGQAASTPFAEHEATTGEWVLERAVGRRPIWWLVRDARGGVAARGTAWLDPLQEITVQVARGGVEAASNLSPAAQSVSPAAARTADGSRRVVLVILDSADWRILRYLDAADEVPTLRRLLGAGTAAVLWSDPPYTAAALQRLVSPGDRTFGLLELAHQLGEEVEALNFVGRNPLEFLEQVLPQSTTLFETLGAGPSSALNLLSAVGAVQSGRNAMISGPGGAERLLTGLVPHRPLHPAELEAIPGVSGDLAQHAELYEQAAGDFDTLEQVLASQGVDFVASRIAALDLMTHATFGALSDAGQHDGDLALLRFYRYLDLRLGKLWRTLDADDTLIVASDHGTLTSFQHDQEALFVAVGPSFEAGRLLDRRLDLAGVSWLVAQLLEVEVDWPAGGFEVLVGSAAGR